MCALQAVDSMQEVRDSKSYKPEAVCLAQLVTTDRADHVRAESNTSLLQAAYNAAHCHSSTD
jgi:hypothetical protein